MSVRLPLDKNHTNKIEKLSREQHWRRETAPLLVAFVNRTPPETSKTGTGRIRQAIYQGLNRAIEGWEQLVKAGHEKHPVPHDLLYRRMEARQKLMGEKPPEITSTQWRTWNLVPFFLGRNKWYAIQFFLETVTGESITAAALRIDYHRLERSFKHIPFDHGLGIHLDKLRGHRRRAHLKIVTERSAYPRLQLALKRGSRSKLLHSR